MRKEQTQISVRDTADVRFSIRTLLLVMVGVAIAAGILGPMFRRLDAKAQATVSQFWAVCAGIVLLWIGYNAWSRIRLERLAGQTLCALMPAGKWFRRVRPWRTVVAGSFWIALGVYYLLLVSWFNREPLNSGHSIMMGGFVAFLMVMGIRTIWWKRNVQLREHGLLRDLRLLRWSHVTRYRWDVKSEYTRRPNEGVNLLIEGVDQRHRDLHLELHIAPDVHPLVDSMLHRLPGREFERAGRGQDRPSTVVPLPHFQIKAKDEISTSRVTGALAVVFFFVVALSLIPAHRVSREFIYGAVAGAIAIGALTVYPRWSTRHSSTPLLRFPARPDWIAVSVASFVTVVCYLCEQIVPTWFPVLSLMLGLVAGIGLVTIFEVFSRDQLDLCENGVVLARLAFWPWNKVRLLRWNEDTNGRLALRCGWRRLVTKVPEPEREIVSVVLAEKMKGEQRAGIANRPATQTHNVGSSS